MRVGKPSVSWTAAVCALLSLGLWGCLGGGGSGGDAATTAPPASSNAIAPVVVASVATGAAPLSVFFDATSSTATTTALPFHAIKYTWSFGDPAGGAKWAYGTRPNIIAKNIAYGPVAAHVFETPGTFTVTLTAFDGTNTATTTQSITVTDPDVVFSGANTVCVASGTFPVAGAGGCPTGAAVQNLSNFDAVVGLATTSKRILLKRGDTWTLPASGTLAVNGPGIIGAYGPGFDPLPVIQFTTNNPAIAMSSAGNWTLVDLEFSGMGAGGNKRILQTNVVAKSNITMLRIRADGVAAALNDQGGINGFTMADSNLTNLAGGAGNNGIYIAENSARVAVLGNQVFNASGIEHCLRFQGPAKMVVSNNTLHLPGATKTALTIRGNSILDAVSALPPGASRTWSGIWAEHIVVSDNVFSRGPFGTGPQNKESDERIRDMIVERNLFTEVGSGIESQVVSGMTIRNNIFNGDPDSSSLVTVVYQNNYGTPAPSSTYIYNNTFYMPTSNAPLRFSAVTITAANGNVTFPTGTVLRNNLAYAPQATSDSQGQQPSGARGTVLAALGVPAGDYDSANNTSNINVKGDNPTFNSTPNPPVTDPAGITAGSWKPTSTANISGLGAAVPVWEDFFSNPQTAVRSLGAVILP